ncbi:MAG: hypothetical protein GY952_07055 [Rhodobacteraceae bacterium]|nr:hypothetical protein [Paracoccaceae bacterium]
MTEREMVVFHFASLACPGPEPQAVIVLPEQCPTQTKAAFKGKFGKLAQAAASEKTWE